MARTRWSGMRAHLRGLLGAVVVLAGVALGTTAPSVAADSAQGRPAPVLPAPTYQSVSHEVLIKMDDGVKLGATVALPSRDGETPMRGKFPVVLGMTPYGRNGGLLAATRPTSGRPAASPARSSTCAAPAGAAAT